MPIQVGETIPNVTLAVRNDDGVGEINTGDICNGKKVVLFALPGAFTPTCSAAHLPGFVVHHDEIKASGVDVIACLSVNDAHVMGAWGDAHNATGNILMLADGNGAFTEAVGLEVDRTPVHMGVRSQRYAMIIEDGVVTHLNVEQPGEFEISDAETVLKLLQI